MNQRISLHNLELYFNKKKPFTYTLKDDSEEFRLTLEASMAYVEPEFSFVREMSNCCDLSEAQIIMIVAVGATGKTELTKRLSFDLQFPIVDLGRTKVVASNSLTGLIFKYMQPLDGGALLEDIHNGETGIIIDALDEGYQKTNTQGFFDFLDDVASKISHKNCSFIMLGRTNAIELATLHLDEKGLNVAVVQIEPFSEQKAKEFIDKRVCASLGVQNENTYFQTRDFVLSSLGNFFNSNTPAYDHQRHRFIGYAPVLLAISEFLSPNKVTNYKALLEDLKKNDNKSISLILDVVDRILVRDKKDKIIPNLLEGLVKTRDLEFRRKVLRDAYTPEEQCARALYIILEKPYPYRPVDDESFDINYRKGLDVWMKDHPFLEERKPANVVFECYILAKLVVNDKYKDAVFKYFASNKVNSFMFFYLYHELNQNCQVSAELIPFLYNSIKTLDTHDLYYNLEIEPSDDAEGITHSYDVSFVSSKDTVKNYDFKIKLDEALVWHGAISDVFICIFQDFVVSDGRTDMFAPSYIRCKNFIVKSNELNYSNRNPENSIVIEAEHVLSETSTGEVPQINSVGSTKKHLTFISEDALVYPYCDYHKERSKQETEMSSEMMEAYQKMRRTLIMFRSHCKGQLAKHYAKIDNRIGNTQVGKVVIQALLDKKIIYRERHVYIIDNESMDKYLGVKFDGIRNSTITKKMLDFLAEVVNKH